MNSPGGGSAPRSAALVLAAMVLWLAATAGTRALTLPDEGRYAGVAYEMLESGDWLTPTLDGLPFFHKPPLFYWITAAALRVFGVNQWSARAAPLVGAVLAGFMLYRFARAQRGEAPAAAWGGESLGRAAALVLLTTPLVFFAGQYANLDMLVAGCITASVLMGAEAVLPVISNSGPPRRSAVVGAWAFAALGMLAKGLIGIVLPALVLLAWLIALRRPLLVLKLLWWPGWLVFAVIAAPWFVAMQNRFADFGNYFFVVQHFKRYTETGFNNAQPFWFYPVVLALTTLPWFAIAWRAVRPAFVKQPEHAPVRWLMLIWIVVVVGFFSLPASKLVGYVLPAAPPLAYLIADSAAAHRGSDWLSKTLAGRGLLIGAVLLCLAFTIVFAVVPLPSTRDAARVLATERRPAEPLIAVGLYPYDLPLYLRSTAPLPVADDWQKPETARGDDWRRELLDAGRFDPARAAVVLIERDGLAERLCASTVTWIIAPPDAPSREEFLSTARVASTAKKSKLWRVDRSEPATAAALHCGDRPMALNTHDAALTQR